MGRTVLRGGGSNRKWNIIPAINIIITMLLTNTITNIPDLIHRAVLAQNTEEFVSIDCGLSSSSGTASKYTDPWTGIEWVADTSISPGIGNWSVAAKTDLPADMKDQMQYSSLRYFPSSNQTKFCYNLQGTVQGSYYLVRATFWYSSALMTLYATRVPGQISFRVIVDTYEGMEIVITLPQVNPWFEEMYIRAQASSVSVCLSAASDSSDVPFINALELRPLPSTLPAVGMITTTNNAMHTVARIDTGTLSADPPILRFPNDTMDRMWWKYEYPLKYVNITNKPVVIGNIAAPMAMMQSNLVSSAGIEIIVSRDAGVLATSTLSGTHYYCAAFYFAELDPLVNSPGQRVFDLSINGALFASDFDIYLKAGGLYVGYEIYTNTSYPLGPYRGGFVVNATATAASRYPPAMAGYEVLQLFEKAMNETSPTSASDVAAVEDLTMTSTLPAFQNFTLGDPCLPLGYKYSWIDCDSSDPSQATRVTAMSGSLSNYGLAGYVPSSIGQLDRLERLDLSNNNLSGEIPISLANLPNLLYLNLENNNFSGQIPSKLQQKEALTFKHEGNPFLCITSNGTCESSPTSSKQNKHNIGLIIAVIGAVLLFILATITTLCILRWRRTKANSTNEKLLEVPFKVKKEEVNEIANVTREFGFQDIKMATSNFSKVLGQGGFGPVYMGVLPDGLAVAVKTLSNISNQGPKEFLNEVHLLSRVHHKNLVGFVGYSIEKSLVLVYEYMPNGSLYDALSRKTTTRILTWLERLHILFDAAQGLAYLHLGCNIVHRDVKSSNILLSKHLEGKMADFGISKLTTTHTAAITTRVIGSKGYLDPEYASTLQLTEKVDIFSFGVVLFEAFCGQPPVLQDVEGETGDVHIVEWVKPSYEGGMIEDVVDKGLETNYTLSSIWKVAEIGMACVQFEGMKRPTISTICNELGEAIRMESKVDPVITIGEMPQAYSYVQAR